LVLTKGPNTPVTLRASAPSPLGPPEYSTCLAVEDENVEVRGKLRRPRPPSRARAARDDGGTKQRGHVLAITPSKTTFYPTDVPYLGLEFQIAPQASALLNCLTAAQHIHSLSPSSFRPPTEPSLTMFALQPINAPTRLNIRPPSEIESTNMNEP